MLNEYERPVMRTNLLNMACTLRSVSTPAVRYFGINLVPRAFKGKRSGSEVVLAFPWNWKILCLVAVFRSHAKFLFRNAYKKLETLNSRFFFLEKISWKDWEIGFRAHPAHGLSNEWNQPMKARHYYYFFASSISVERFKCPDRKVIYCKLHKTGMLLVQTSYGFSKPPLW